MRFRVIPIRNVATGGKCKGSGDYCLATTEARLEQPILDMGSRAPSGVVRIGIEPLACEPAGGQMANRRPRLTPPIAR